MVIYEQRWTSCVVINVSEMGFQLLCFLLLFLGSKGESLYE